MTDLERLKILYDELDGSDFWAVASHDEQAEIYRIRMLNEIIRIANRLGLSKLAYLAGEAKENDDVSGVLASLEEMFE
jgi:hypothetical protein